MAWWVTALIYIGLTLVYELIRPKPKFDSPDPSSIGDFQFPTVGEGRPIPIVWGTCKLAGPMVTWYGDLEVQAMKKTVQTGLFTWEEITTHYRYWLGIQLVLSSGEIDEVVEIRFDDKPCENVTFTPQANRTKVHVDEMSFFGGDDEEGGVYGDIYVYHGNSTQVPHPYLQDQLGDDIPAWRQICYAVFDHVYLGTSPYIKDVALVLRRCPNSLGLTGGAENINGDANPAAMIYELLVRAPGKNGLGLPEGFVDVDSFRAVGQTLADESMGLSMVQDRSTPARDLILEILRHIDGIVYVEPSTGLLTITLVRFDYSEEELPVLDADACTVTAFARASWGEIKNQVRVSYVDRADGFVEKTVQAQDLAAIEAQGGEVSTQDLQLRGFSNAASAQQAAARALVAVAYPLASLTIEADRTAWSFRPGTVFKLVWPPLGIDGMVCRVLRVGTGELLSGEVLIEAMEDIFAVDWTAYTPPSSSGWIDPSGEVPALTDQAGALAPYEAVKFHPFQGSDVQQAVVMAARGTPGVSKGFNVYVDSEPTRFPFFTPSGTLESAIDETTDEITIATGPDCNIVESVNGADYAQGVNVAWLEHDALEEFIAFQTVASGADTLTLQVLARGCLDTAPTPFPSGTRVWFMSYGNGLVNILAPIPPSTTRSNVLTFQPYNNKGGYPLGSCLDTTVVATAPPRSEKVYCLIAVLFNGASYPSSISGELTVSWSHRNRLGTWSYADSGATDEAEDGTEYDILVYGELGTLVHTETGLTGTSWTYPEADEIAESGLGRLNNHLRVIIWTWGASRTHEAIREIEWEFDRI